MTPTKLNLRQAWRTNGLARVMAAHNPLCAMLAEAAGFDGLWASGFELSASYGLPDVSLISMTDHLAMVRAIAERTSVPIVADIDTGYGNAINVLHTVGAMSKRAQPPLSSRTRHSPR